METQKAEIAAVAARWVVEDGLEYGAAKQAAAKQLGLRGRIAWPGNDELEDAVREYIAIFAADTQPGELAALRALALYWMERLQAFRPHLTGAVWHGTATQHSDIYLDLFCDDLKSVELHLIDQQLRYETAVSAKWSGGEASSFHLQVRCQPLQMWVGLHLLVSDYDDLRGALKPDGKGRSPRGNWSAVRILVHDAGL